MGRYLIATTIVILLIIIAGAVYLKIDKPIIDSGQPSQIFCTKEAKLCPDGVTYVGRQGPKCEFALCPLSTTTKTTKEMTGMKNSCPAGYELYVGPANCSLDASGSKVCTDDLITQCRPK